MKVGGLSVLLSILLSIIILLGTFFSITFDYNFHHSQITSNELINHSNQLTTLINELHYLINYLNSGPFIDDKILNQVDFTKSEKDHMIDVKKIFLIIQGMFLTSLITFFTILTKINKKKIIGKKDLKKILSKILRNSAIINISFIILIGIFALFFFDSFWNNFHKVLFPQGNWMFPRNSKLITLFPSSYFYNFILNLTLAVISFSGISYFMGKKMR